MGVLPVNNTALRYDSKQIHKVAIDLTMPYQDSSKASFGITEIGRTFNLHVANGASKESMDMVVIVHGPAIRTFLNDELYSKRNGIPNPNIPVIQELSRNGVKFYVCGQSLGLLKMPSESFIPELKVAISAKTAITDFQAKGYSFLYFDQD
jgi:intracellular sulfur oxidation DsrE/DsrF family protein